MTGPELKTLLCCKLLPVPPLRTHRQKRSPAATPSRQTISPIEEFESNARNGP
jgi:hypothetical protein